MEDESSEPSDPDEDSGFEFGADDAAPARDEPTSGEPGADDVGTDDRDDPADEDDTATDDDRGGVDETVGEEDTVGDDETVGDDDTATDDDGRGGLIGATRRRAPFPETSRTTLYALVAMTVAGLAMRLIWLGSRVAHQDEGRVGYWIIRYLESGVWEYRAIVHGPFLFHVNKYVFDLLGPSDFTMRLPVAVIGAALPLVAWLFRDHLRDTEVLALGALLTLNPVLLYYSRFMRNDVPLAAFMLAAVGFAVRYYDTRRYRHVFAAVGAFALGMTTKENGLLYAACWLGAAALLLDHRLFAASHKATERGVLSTALAYAAWVVPVTVHRLPGFVKTVLAVDDDPVETTDEYESGARPRYWLSVDSTAVAVVGAAVVEFFAIIVFFYAPRGGGYLKAGGGGPPSYADDTTDAMGLYSSLGDLGRGDPAQFFAVVEEATVGSWQEFTAVWGGHEHSYLLFARHYVEVMIAGALVVSTFAVVGFLVDRYGDGGPRDLVALSAYWGFVSVLGYPIATDIRAGWATTHAIVPLAIPAAVALAIVFRWAVASYTLDDAIGLGLALLLLFTVFGQMGVAVNDLVYQNPQSPDNKIVQYAQPSTDTKPELERVRELGLAHGGAGDTDVLFWGDNFAIRDESGLNQPPAPGPYYGRRTWMWYMEMYQYDANQSGEHFVYHDTDNESRLNETKPPVVVTLGRNEGPRYPKDGGEELHQWLLDNGYEQVSHQRYGNDPDAEVTRPILFYFRTDPNESTGTEPFQRDGDGDGDGGPTVPSLATASQADRSSPTAVAQAWGWRWTATAPDVDWRSTATAPDVDWRSTAVAPPGSGGARAPRPGSTVLNAARPYVAGNEQCGAFGRRTAVDGARLQRGPVA